MVDHFLELLQDVQERHPLARLHAGIEGAEVAAEDVAVDLAIQCDHPLVGEAVLRSIVKPMIPPV